MTARLLKTLAGALLALTLASMLTVSPARAQGGPAQDALPQPLASWQADLDRLEGSIGRVERSDDALVRLRQDLRRVREKAEDYARSIGEQHEALKSQLDKLGPAPKDEEPAESEAAAKLRQDLTAQVAELDGAMRAADVVQTRARQIIEIVQAKRRKLFSGQLLNRSGRPLTGSFWTTVAERYEIVTHRLGLLAGQWWQAIRHPGWLLALLAGAVAIWAGLRALATIAVSRYRALDPDELPSRQQRAASAGAVTLARAIPPIAATGLLLVALSELEMLPARSAQLATDAWLAIALTSGLIALAYTLLAPNQPRWRIIYASDSKARALRWLAYVLAAIYGLDLFLEALAVTLVAPLTFTVAQRFVANLMIAIVLTAILLVPIWRDRPADAKKGWFILFRVILWGAVVTILAASALGYVALAQFVTTRLILTGTILILLYLLHHTIEAIAASIADPDRAGGRWLAGNFALSSDRHAQLGLLAWIVLQLLLLALVVPLILLQWGFSLEDMRNWIQRGFFGFEIGNWRISLWTILAALVLFVLGFFVTRFVQRWIDSRVLERAQFDQGARSAIRTAIGYLGIALAGLVAISYAGIDFSNIAIVAGALSVGIGFGLQSIVNNFVSGLILLAERRISVGDRIIVGEDEGYVRRISVRATEIETFDRNFVIIPNSQLMTNAVKNWTFQHRRARVTIDVGVGYGSDPRHVERVLLDCANRHPAIIFHDQTEVWFMDFGDSALLFRLKAFVGDVTNMLTTRSDLRFSIMEAFREEGIEIPFPQQDLHLKDIDRLEAALSGKAKASPRTASKRAASKRAAATKE